jgi:hypothetical protein
MAGRRLSTSASARTASCSCKSPALNSISAPAVTDGWLTSMNSITALRALQPHNIDNCMKVAFEFEKTAMRGSKSAEEWRAQLGRKMNEIRAKREQQAQLQNGMMGIPPNGMPNMPTNMMGGVNMGVPGGMMHMPNGQMNMPNPAQPHSGFPNTLQRPMQPSPMPPQPQQPNTMDPSMLQNTPAQQNGNPQQPAPAMPQPGQGANLQARALEMEARRRAQQTLNSLSEEKKQQMRQQTLGGMSEQQRIKIESQGLDALFMAMVSRNRQQLAQQHGIGRPQNSNQLSMNGQQNAGAGGNAQPANGQQSGAPKMDYNHIRGQQMNGLKSQESGEQVVPASNNSNFMGGATNMPNQGINSQMLGNGGAPNQALQQRLEQLQKMNQQNNLAMQHAQQQSNQLRGQPGGLNASNALNGGPAGQVHSPSMSMLNRPMAPPGQPTTPQQNRPPTQQPQTPMNLTAQNVAQHHQHLMNQNGSMMMQPGQGQNPPDLARQRELAELTQGLPPALRQQIISSNLPTEQARALAANMREQMLARQRATQPGFNMGGQQAGPMPNMPNVPNMGQQPMGGMQQGGLPDSAIPGFNAHPPMQQPSNGQSNMDPLQLQQRMQQQQAQQRVSREISMRAMASRPFNRAVVGTLNLNVPANIQTWGQLNAWVEQAQQSNVLPPDTVEKLRRAQFEHFRANPLELRMATEQMRQHMLAHNAMRNGQQPQQPQSTGPPNMGLPNGGQAPPAQMVPPAAMMQPPMAGQQHPSVPPNQRPNFGGGPQMPSIEDVQNFRLQNPQVGGTDDQLRQALFRHRQQQYRQMMQVRTEALRNAQRTSQNMPAGQQPQPQQRTTPQNQPDAQQIGKATPQSGQKRAAPQPPSASSDDVMEIPNPNAAAPPQPATGATQAPPMQPNHSQQRMVPPPPPGLPAAMLPAWQAANDEGRKKLVGNLRAQQMSQQNTQQTPTQQTKATGAAESQQSLAARLVTPEMNKTREIYQEIERSLTKGPQVPYDEAGLKKAIDDLIWCSHKFEQVRRTWPIVLRVHPHLEPLLRETVKASVLVAHNISEPKQGCVLKGYVSLSEQELNNIKQLLQRYSIELQKAKQQAGQGQAAQQQARPQPPSAPNRPQQPSAPQAAAMGRSASQSHQRKASTSKPPAAPTDNTKSFDWNIGAPSPHGVPKYDANRQDLTPDKLKMPPNKKRRVGPADSQASTPGAQTGTPAAASASPNMGNKAAASPEQQAKRSAQQIKQEVMEKEHREQQMRLKHRCPENLCEASIKGFETEQELHRHMDAEHKPVEDPLAFLLENAAMACDVDAEGRPLPQQAKEGAQGPSRATPAIGARPGIKAGTPNVKAEVATPPAPSRPVPKPFPTVAPVGETPKEKEKTLRESLEEKMGYSPFVQPAELPMQDVPMDPAALAMTEEDQSFYDIIQSTLGGMEGVDDALDFTGNVATWNLGPEHLDTATVNSSSPELTPGTTNDSASQSSRASDISRFENLRINFEWDPWGDGDTYVPEGLIRLTEGATPGMMKPDVEMAGVGASGDEGKKAAAMEEWDWSGDQLANNDWEAIFGT